MREGLQPECPLGNLHVNRPLVKSEFQNVFPFAETLGDRWGNRQINVDAKVTVSDSLATIRVSVPAFCRLHRYPVNSRRISRNVRTSFESALGSTAGIPPR